jgi:hypothetical protein
MNNSRAFWPQRRSATPQGWGWPASARRAIAAYAWPIQQRLYQLAGTSPSLDLEFARNERLIDSVTGSNLITFTRDSTATYVAGDGRLKTAAVNEARFDHNPTTGESLGLLVEEQRTNLFQYSEEFNNAYWNKGNAAGTVTANQAVAPDGATTADLYQEDTASSGRYLVRSIAFTGGTSYTVSCWAKQAPGATRYLGIVLPAGAFGVNTNASFTLSGTGSFAIAVSGTNTSAQIQSFPNGWYRCTLASQATATASAGVQIRLSASATSGVGSYAGDGSSGIYLWGAQLEAAAFPTSYIPTTTATVTRSADVASISGSNFSAWYRQDEGTVFYDGQVLGSDPSANRNMLGLSSGSDGNAINMFIPSAANQRFRMVKDGVSQALQNTVSTANVFNPVRCTYAFRLDDTTSAFNGTVLTTDTSCSIPTVDRFTFGSVATGEAQLAARYKRVTFWPQRLSNTTLQAVTQ